jgi:uncharacterized protein with von Willebrand factor type A (vWA) domain
MLDSEVITTEIFYRIRKKCELGMREYLAAIEAIKSGYESRLELRKLLQMLWCHSYKERCFFEQEWDIVYQAALKAQSQKESEQRDRSEEKTGQDDLRKSDRDVFQGDESDRDKDPETTPEETENNINFSYDTFYAPSVRPSSDEDLDLGLYFPVSRRSMIYLWRFLRRPVADGVADVLDVPATVDRAARQGFYWQPVLRRRVTNRAHLLLLVDRGGSMTPCHRFAEDIVETACEDGQFGRVDVLYFYNVPTDHVYADDRLTKPIALETALECCDRDTSVVIVSDGGAARGYRDGQRLEKTRKFLLTLHQCSSLIGWLNPIPKDRWYGSSAEFIAYLVPMREMSNDGMGQIIDVVKGTSVHHSLGVG